MSDSFPLPPLPSPSNPPNRETLAYRAGTYADFLRRMRTALPLLTVAGPDGQPQQPLAPLRTAADDDPSMALLGAAAVVADVLTFYGERIANEGYLTTALERRSVLELARAVGYELVSGVAATTYLAFTAEDTAAVRGRCLIPVGTAAHSLPGPGESQQVFETSQALTVRTTWNELSPRKSRRQSLRDGSNVLFLDGTTTKLNPGDLLLVIWRGISGAPDIYQTALVKSVTVMRPEQKTRVELLAALQPPAAATGSSLSAGLINDQSVPFTEQAVRDDVMMKRWSEADLASLLDLRGWEEDDVLSVIARLRASSDTTVEVYALRQRLGCFGNNAPSRDDIPSGTVPSDTDWQGRAPDSHNIWTDHSGDAWSPAPMIYLERSVPEVLAGTFVVLRDNAAGRESIFTVQSAADRTLAQYGLTGTATGLSLLQMSGAAPNRTDATKYALRTTTAFVVSERLTLATLPILDPLPTGDPTIIELDTMVLGLRPDQPLWVRGEPWKAAGTVRHQIVRIASVVHECGYTRLSLQQPLRDTFSRGSVRINANVVMATHGETTPDEVLGSGDATQTYQEFRLHRPNLVYTPAPTLTGLKSSLQVFVDGHLWQEVASFYGCGPSDAVYLVRHDDDGLAAITFGDGVRGRRLPSGQENVIARYRTADVLAGSLDAFRLTLLRDLPLGIRSVTNPVPAVGAHAPETRDEARHNASLHVRTLDRAIGLRDYAAFACASAGLSKATAALLWNGASRMVHLTVAPEDGRRIADDDPVIGNLTEALGKAADPFVPVGVSGYTPAYFAIAADLVLDPAVDPHNSLASAQAALEAKFSFAERDFGEPVTAAEVLSILQNVPGVRAAQLRKLARLGDIGDTGGQVLVPQPARLDLGTGRIIAAELLLLQPGGVTLKQMEVRT